MAEPTCEGTIEKSLEQIEDGISSISLSDWDMDDDKDCGGPKPSDMYGHFTWKIDKFSQLDKKELRSDVFEVGSYKWYLLMYPRGCEVCDYLSLFLCMAKSELLPGWSHLAQFTLCLVNKDPKTSKYSDTLHRFSEQEHDWGWKKFIELAKVSDGFIVDDQLIIKAQVQVFREKPDRPFRCLDSHYRKTLLEVYWTDVEQICHSFLEEKINKLVQFREDKARWSSFCSFWIAIDQSTRRKMCMEKADTILRAIVKHFFIEREVTSTLVMDSLNRGLRALEGHSKGNNGNIRIVHLENDSFVLVDDLLKLLERDSSQSPSHRKDGRIKDWRKDTVILESCLTELGRKIIETYVFAHLFSKIDIAHQEDFSLQLQEELIARL